MGILRRSSNSNRLARRTRKDGTTKDRGAVMIEAIIVLPLLVLLVLGISEFGFIFRSTITISATSRSAARVSSNVANARGADYETLNTIIASLGSSSIELADVEGVLIYNATGVDTVPSNCLVGEVANGSSSTGLECNHYDGTDLAFLANNPPAVTAPNFGLNADGTTADPLATTCNTGDIDYDFCPLLRNRTPNPNTEYVGVWIQVRHKHTTGILPWTSITLEDKTVMGIEPLGTL